MEPPALRGGGGSCGQCTSPLRIPNPSAQRPLMVTKGLAVRPQGCLLRSLPASCRWPWRFAGWGLRTARPTATTLIRHEADTLHSSRSGTARDAGGVSVPPQKQQSAHSNQLNPARALACTGACSQAVPNRSCSYEIPACWQRDTPAWHAGLSTCNPAGSGPGSARLYRPPRSRRRASWSRTLSPHARGGVHGARPHARHPLHGG